MEEVIATVMVNVGTHCITICSSIDLLKRLNVRNGSINQYRHSSILLSG